jgi:hypothetical protein
MNGIHTCSESLDVSQRRLKVAKSLFVDGYQAGRFGNRAPTWNTINELADSSYSGLVHIRNRVAGGPTWYDVPADKVARVYCEVTQQGLLRPADAYFSGMAPTALTTIQGEVRRSERGLDLTYSRVAKPMRQSLLEGSRSACGLIAQELLRYYMDAPSYDWLNELLTEYPESVVEFSCYGTRWGTLGLNTVFWEVRNY